MRAMVFYLHIFSIFSLAGWLLEFFYRSLRLRRFTNPGFLKGPYLPLYGTIAVLLTLVIALIQDHPIVFISPHFNLPLQMPPVSQTIAFRVLAIMSRGLVYAFITTGVEMVIGLVFTRFLKIPLWNYNQQFLSIAGCVCLRFSFYWVILAFMFEYVALPLTLKGVQYVNPLLLNAAAMAVCLAMAVDFLRQFPLNVRAVKVREDRDTVPQREEFNRILRPLLDIPAVQSLSDHRHHRDKTRLAHSLEVAWYGYAFSKKWSLDYASAARGGLLHDLFFYNWLTEGPRLHGFRHPAIALKNAEEIADIGPVERDIIKKHMWPLTPVPPRHLESWAICLADTYCSVRDYLAPVVRATRGHYKRRAKKAACAGDQIHT